MTGVSKRTTLNANGVHLRYLVGNGTERRNRSERNAFVIHIEPGNYDSYAIVRQLVANVYKNCASSMPTTSISEANSNMFPDELIGVE